MAWAKDKNGETVHLNSDTDIVLEQVGSTFFAKAYTTEGLSYILMENENMIEVTRYIDNLEATLIKEASNEV